MTALTKIDNSLMELQKTEQLCQQLLSSPHYKKIGMDGVYAIVAMAKSTGLDPMQALNGGLYYAKGKVEMTTSVMGCLIRQAGHSVTKDKRSTEKVCILHGRRADTGDTWSVSFSVEDARAAGLFKNSVWSQYTSDMLFARALSRLARQLFPDVIKGCYVQGEIELAQPITNDVDEVIEEAVVVSTLGEEEAANLESALLNFPDYKAQVDAYLERQKIELCDVSEEDGAKIWAKVVALGNEMKAVAHG